MSGVKWAEIQKLIPNEWRPIGQPKEVPEGALFIVRVPSMLGALYPVIRYVKHANMLSQEGMPSPFGSSAAARAQMHKLATALKEDHDAHNRRPETDAENAGGDDHPDA